MSAVLQETLLVKTTLNPMVKAGLLAEETYRNILSSMKNPASPAGSPLRWLTIAETCKLLTISEPTLRKLLVSGGIRFKRIGAGRLVRIEEASVLSYLEGKIVPAETDDDKVEVSP